MVGVTDRTLEKLRTIKKSSTEGEFTHALEDYAATYSLQLALTGGRDKIIKKSGVLKGPADYRPASNSYPSQIIRRDDCQGVVRLALQSWFAYLILIPRTNSGHSTH